MPILLRSARLAGRRFASTHSHDHHHVPTMQPTPEGFGKGFFLSIASVIGVLAIIKADTSGDQPAFITRLIDRYHSRTEVWAARNLAHTDILVQAAEDRMLFQDSPSKRRVAIKNPETLNAGSPWNNEAGRGYGGDLKTTRMHLEALREKHAESFRK
ncbi:hypothetical protein BZA05DRAFT_407055 [Tricharina praecox]|uniref:uncharacterized protein n=1 Tax=Tricharina praecox TaxID=43433 RepID=UPI002220DB83|nr:uncharacterized protein BZA05DRAFT_407055 [Tricharina praecox]KAI5846141.1 hypothetical protein BZA05DRAFT_407055 [Tricharina praecox]